MSSGAVHADSPAQAAGDRERVSEIRIVRPVSRYQRSGLLRREDPFPSSLSRIKEELRLVAARAKAPVEDRGACLAICCEAVSNWWRHNHTGDLRFLLYGRPGCIEQAYQYPTTVFNTNPPEPEELAESGMGIIMMRGLCIPGWEPGQSLPEHPNVSFQFSAGRVTLRLVRRW